MFKLIAHADRLPFASDQEMRDLIGLYLQCQCAEPKVLAGLKANILEFLKENSKQKNFNRFVDSKGGQTTLVFETAFFDDAGFLQQLHLLGLNPFLKRETGFTVLHMAVLNGARNVVRLCMELIKELHVPLEYFKYGGIGFHPGHMAVVFSPAMKSMLLPFYALPGDEGLTPEDFEVLLKEDRKAKEANSRIRYGCCMAIFCEYLMEWIKTNHSLNLAMRWKLKRFLPPFQEFVRLRASGELNFSDVVAVREIDKRCGRGVFAKRPIPLGQVAAVFNGIVQSRRDEKLVRLPSASEEEVIASFLAEGYTETMLFYGTTMTPVLGGYQYLCVPWPDAMSSGAAFMVNDGWPNALNVSMGLNQFLMSLGIAEHEQIRFHYGACHPVKCSKDYVIEPCVQPQIRAFVTSMNWVKIVNDMDALINEVNRTKEEDRPRPLEEALAIFAAFVRLQYVIETPPVVMWLQSQGVDMHWIYSVLADPKYQRHATNSEWLIERYHFLMRTSSDFPCD